MNVGFVGLGGMGKPMAVNILKAGFQLTVNDIREKPVRELVQLGAKAGASPKEVAASSNIVLTSLPSIEASEEVALGNNGVLAGAKMGDLYIDTSTITPAVIRKIAGLAAKKGIEVMDAPVSGHVDQRIGGTLTIMVGSTKEETLKRARPVLEAVGSNIIHVGDVGAGNMAKLAHNFISNTHVVTVMEGMILGVKAGLDVEKLIEVVKVSAGGSPLFERLSNLILTKSFDPPAGEVASQALRHTCKDMKLALELAEELSISLPVGAEAFKIWMAGKDSGLGDKEYWSLISLFEDLAGSKVRRQSQ